MTDEQAAAFAQLRFLAAPGRYRVVADAEGYPVMRGKRGDIEWYHAEGRELCAYTAGPKVRRGRLLSLPNITRHQVGEAEVRIRFPVGMLPEVARAIRARRRRVLDPEAARKLGAGTAYRVGDSGGERVPTGGAAITHLVATGEGAVWEAGASRGVSVGLARGEVGA